MGARKPAWSRLGLPAKGLADARLLVREHSAWIATGLAWSAFVAGTIWRWMHILHLHDPRDYVFSDMSMYVGLAKRFAQPGYKLVPGDLTHPPGLATIFSWLYARDPSMQTMVYFQFVVCALVPLAVGGLGWVAFGKNTGKIALAAASLYFPFVDYGGYFLTEIHFIFTLPLAMALCLLATWQKTTARLVLFGLLGGLAVSLAMVTKVLAFPAIACFLFFYLVFWRGPPRRRRAITILAILLGSIPINAWQVTRCTMANEGKFCLGSNKGASDFLLGHYGRIGVIIWHDPERGTITFGSPSAHQHGYSDRVDVDFGVTNNDRNLQVAIGWIKDNPRQALLLSLEHVYDLFFGSFPWPAVGTKYWVGSAGAHYAFICLLLFPSCMRLVDILRSGGGLRALLSSTEALVLAPVVGLIVTAAIATGEPRYRIPFDSLFLVVSIEFFRRAIAAPRVQPATPLPLTAP